MTYKIHFFFEQFPGTKLKNLKILADRYEIPRCSTYLPGMIFSLYGTCYRQRFGFGDLVCLAYYFQLLS